MDGAAVVGDEDRRDAGGVGLRGCVLRAGEEQGLGRHFRLDRIRRDDGDPEEIGLGGAPPARGARRPTGPRPPAPTACGGTSWASFDPAAIIACAPIRLNW